MLVVPAVEHYEEAAVLNHLHGLQIAPTLRDPVPGLIFREIEVAMSKLGLLYDHTYTWDIFSDMMVTLKTSPPFLNTVCLVGFESSDVCFRGVSSTMRCPAVTCQSNSQK